MNNKKNLVLIGMPTSGKSELGRMLSERLSMELLDTDILVEQRAKKRIADIFAEEGEEYFRELEGNAVISAAAHFGAVIACGGGVIKRESNIEVLRRNGAVFFIDRDLSLLSADSSRPLSSNRNDLEKIYRERIELYRRYADFLIENNNDPESALIKIISIWDRLRGEGSNA